MSISDILDESWIQEQQRIQDIKHNYYRESISSISIYSIFINNDKNIDKIIKSEFQTSQYNDTPNSTYIPKDTIVQLIQDNKKYNKNKHDYQYKLQDITSFFVTLEPEEIQSYSKIDDLSNAPNFFKFHPSIQDIIIPPSIFIFHKINSIFLVYQEIINRPHNNSIKSILKPGSNKQPKHSNTKKVRIDTQLNQSYSNTNIKHKKTRKHITTS